MALVRLVHGFKPHIILDEFQTQCFCHIHRNRVLRERMPLISQTTER